MQNEAVRCESFTCQCAVPQLINELKMSFVKWKALHFSSFACRSVVWKVTIKKTLMTASFTNQSPRQSFLLQCVQNISHGCAPTETSRPFYCRPISLCCLLSFKPACYPPWQLLQVCPGPAPSDAMSQLECVRVFVCAWVCLSVWLHMIYRFNEIKLWENKTSFHRRTMESHKNIVLVLFGFKVQEVA